MRRHLPLLLICACILGGCIYWLYTAGAEKTIDQELAESSAQRQTGAEPQEPTEAAPPASLRTRPPSFPKTTTLLPAAAEAEFLHSPDTTSEEDLSLLHGLLRAHRKVLGGNPVGLNDEITAALTGRNLKGVASLPPKHPAISKDGELLDRWGTPYRFHAYSGKMMEIRSAGPDKQHFTADDITLRE